MFLTSEEIDEIRRQIIEGVEAARRDGVVCDYPDSFTVIKTDDGNQVSATFPIWTIANPKSFD